MAAKYLRDLAVYADDAIVEEFKGGFVQRFHRESCCVSEHVRRLLSGSLITNGVAKVHVECVDCRYSAANIPTPHPIIEVVCCTWPFSFSSYLAATELDRKKMLGKVIHECLSAIALKWNWDTKLIDDAYEQLERENYVFTGMSKASWPSPSSGYRMRIAVDWKLSCIELWAVLFKNRTRTEIARKQLGELLPEMGTLNDAITSKHGKWVTETEFELVTSDFLQKRMRVSFKSEMM